MNKLRITITLLLMVFAMTVSAQDAYREAVRKYMDLSPSKQFSNEDKTEALLKVYNMQALANYSEKTSETLAKRYLATQWKEDMTDMMVNIYKGHVSLEELQEMTAIIDNELGRSFLAHSGTAAAQMNAEMTGIVMKLLMGGKDVKEMEPVSYDEQYPSDYLEAFDRYYEVSTMEDLIGGIVNMLQKAPKDKDSRRIEQMLTYLKDNLKAMVLHCYYPLVTIEELHLGTRLGQTEGWKHQLEAAKSRLNDAGLSMSNPIDYYVQWLATQDIELK